MKFGVRECANIVFRAKQPIRIGTATFQAGQPVLYIDTATTSSMEQSTETVYAQGGRGNARLLAWEGEKTLTFSFTDALLSPIGFAILSGAGLFKRGNGIDSTKEEGLVQDFVHFHMTSGATLHKTAYTAANNTTNPATAESNEFEIDLRDAIAEFGDAASISLDDAPVYIMEIEDDGSLTGNVFTGQVTTTKTVKSKVIELKDVKDASGKMLSNDVAVMVDYYIDLPGKHVYEADITPDTFGGNYYVEADTLFRDQYSGKDLPANLTFPNVRLQSNFTMTFAGTGDPSTFDFTMDAFPGYTYFDKKKKVLAVLQVVDSIGLGGSNTSADADPVMYHDNADQAGQAKLYDSDLTPEEAGAIITTAGLFTAIDGYEHNNQDATSGNTAPYVLDTLLHAGDTISLRDYLAAKDNNGNDVLDKVRPTFAAYSTTNNAGYVEIGMYDGHVKNLKPSGENKVIIAASVVLNSTTTDTVYFAVQTEGQAQG